MIFLTGATGYLGSYILLDLLEHGFKVRASRRGHSSMRRVEKVFQHFSSTNPDLLNNVEWIDADILDVFSLQDTMKDIDTVVHCAGYVSFDRGKRKKLMELNAEGTANVVNVCLRNNVRKLLYVSSIAAMGRGGDDEVISEKTVWKNSKLNTHYAVSKYCGEKEVWRGYEEGLQVVVINPSFVLGYGEKNQGTYRLFNTINKGQLFYPDGINGFVYSRDVARAVTVLLQQEISGEKFIISAANLSYGELFNLIGEVIHKRPPLLRVGKGIVSLAWRIESLRSALIGTMPLLTHETAVTSTQRYLYDGKKITSLDGFSYTPLAECLAEIWQKYQEDESGLA